MSTKPSAVPSSRGLEIVNAAIVGLEYDVATRELLTSVQRADALLGARGNSNLQASVAAGLQAAGEDGGAAGILGMAFVTGTMGVAGIQQPMSGAPTASPGGANPASSAPEDDDPVVKLSKLKQLLDAGLITQADYKAAKAKVLGL